LIEGGFRLFKIAPHHLHHPATIVGGDHVIGPIVRFGQDTRFLGATFSLIKLAGLAQSLSKDFGIPRERTFVAGLSAGAAMAEILGATYPDVFEAVGIHSGLAYKSASDVPSAFAAMKGGAEAASAPRVVAARDCRKIIFHGAADATVNPVNAQRILDEARDGADALKQIDLDWDIDAGRVTRTVLNDSAGRAMVEQWLVEGGGHAWFGGDPRGTYTQKVGLDASRVMVRFFLKQ